MWLVNIEAARRARHTMPAWKDADGCTTFCADTDVAMGRLALEREEKEVSGKIEL